MENAADHPWSLCTEMHLWLCKVLHNPEMRHVMPSSTGKLTDADVFYLVDELNNLEPYATFTDEKNKALILFRWLCHLLVEEDCLNEFPCMADRPLAKRLHVHCVKAREPWSKRAVYNRLRSRTRFATDSVSVPASALAKAPRAALVQQSCGSDDHLASRPWQGRLARWLLASPAGTSPTSTNFNGAPTAT